MPLFNKSEPPIPYSSNSPIEVFFYASTSDAPNTSPDSSPVMITIFIYYSIK